jgi:acetyl esterase/lipase
MSPKSIPPVAVVLIALLACATPLCAIHAEDRYRTEVFPKVHITRDVAYRPGGEAGGRNNDVLLDVYEPEGDEELLRPIVVWIHGGGFYQGDKTDAPMAKLSTHFARCGFVCASINYTLLLRSSSDWNPGIALRQAVDRATEDARHALCFLASQRERFRIDVGRLLVGGGSAGAFTALQLGCGEQNPCGVRVRGIIEFWGGLMDISLMRSGSPPILAIHGTADTTVPYAFAERLVARGTDIGARVELHALRNEGHSAWSNMEQYVAWIHEFIESAVW